MPKDLIAKYITEARHAANRFKITKSPDDKHRIERALEAVRIALENEFSDFSEYLCGRK